MIVAMMAVILAVGSPISYAATTQTAEASGAEASRAAKREIAELRGKNVKHYEMGDGSRLAEVFLNEVHYEDETGKLEDIDTRLYDTYQLDQVQVPLPKSKANKFNKLKNQIKSQKQNKTLDVSTTAYTPLQVPYDADIPKKIANGYQLTYGQNSFVFKPVSASPKAIAKITGDKAYYENVWANTDLELIVMPDGIKENIILKNDKAPNSFSFEVQGPLSDSLFTDDIQIWPAWLEDAKGEKRDVALIIRTANKRTYLDLSWDDSGLAYPVIIDPTISFNAKDAFYVDSRYPNNYPDGYFDLRAAYGRYGSVQETFMRFYFPELPLGSSVISSTLSMYLYDATVHTGIPGAKSASINVRPQSFELWSTYPSRGGTPFTWTSRPTVTSDFVGSDAIILNTAKNQTFEWDITSYASLINNQRSKYGTTMPIALLSTGSYGAYLIDARFASNSTTIANQRPKISVQYTVPSSIPTIKLLSHTDGQKAATKLRFSWAFAEDPNKKAQHVHIRGTRNNWQTTEYEQYAYDINRNTFTTGILPTGKWQFSIRVYYGSSYSDWVTVKNIEVADITHYAYDANNQVDYVVSKGKVYKYYYDLNGNLVRVAME
ncbi:DNRLRE domain-containing protein [Paenibacillus xanthanilyticus]|uniref:DNRLRE domain-containing protein n=2 Tax=Paenibacillus xanthanilyticus TaxID=1783531 RepID=A0ABV8KE24_9BACL